MVNSRTIRQSLDNHMQYKLRRPVYLIKEKVLSTSHSKQWILENRTNIRSVEHSTSTYHRHEWASSGPAFQQFQFDWTQIHGSCASFAPHALSWSPFETWSQEQRDEGSPQFQLKQTLTVPVLADNRVYCTFVIPERYGTRTAYTSSDNCRELMNLMSSRHKSTTLTISRHNHVPGKK